MPSFYEPIGFGANGRQRDHMDWRNDFERVIDDPRIRRLLIEGFDRP